MGNFIKDYSYLMGCLLFYECTEEDQGSQVKKLYYISIINIDQHNKYNIINILL